MTRGAAAALLCGGLLWPTGAEAADGGDRAAEPSRREIACYERYQESVRRVRGPVFNPDYMTPEERGRHERAMRDAESQLKICLAGTRTE